MHNHPTMSTCHIGSPVILPRQQCGLLTMECCSFFLQNLSVQENEHNSFLVAYRAHFTLNELCQIQNDENYMVIQVPHNSKNFEVLENFELQITLPHWDILDPKRSLLAVQQLRVLFPHLSNLYRFDLGTFQVNLELFYVPIGFSQ